jgi:hypothetical protein
MFDVEVALPRISAAPVMPVYGGSEYTSIVERRASLPQASSD